MNFMGKISYGLYVYHFIAVVVILKVATHYFSFNNSFIQNIYLYTAVFGFSILISYVSYRFLELPLLRLKNKYTSIVSGDAVKE